MCLRQKNGKSSLVEFFPVLEDFSVLLISLSTAVERGSQLNGNFLKYHLEKFISSTSNRKVPTACLGKHEIHL